MNINLKTLSFFLGSLLIASEVFGWETLSEGGKVVFESKTVFVNSGRSLFGENYDFKTPVLCKACLSVRKHNVVYEGLSISSVTILEADSHVGVHSHVLKTVKTMFFCKADHWWVKEVRTGACYCGWRADESFNDAAARLNAGLGIQPERIFVMPRDRKFQGSKSEF